MERHRTLRAMIQDKSGQQSHACRHSTKSQKTIVRVIRSLCKQTYEGLNDWNRNQMVYMWVEDTVFIEMHIEDIVAL